MVSSFIQRWIYTLFMDKCLLLWKLQKLLIESLCYQLGHWKKLLLRYYYFQLSVKDGTIPIVF